MHKTARVKCAVLACAIAVGAGIGWAETLYVNVQSSPVRATPTPFGKIVGALSHGAAVDVVQKQPGWYQVQGPGGVKGWVNQSQFQKDKVVLSAGSSTAQTGASAREQGAAAKGFTPQVEQQYKGENPDLAGAYKIIDQMEKKRASESDVVEFLKEGGVL